MPALKTKIGFTQRRGGAEALRLAAPAALDHDRRDNGNALTREHFSASPRRRANISSFRVLVASCEQALVQGVA